MTPKPINRNYLAAATRATRNYKPYELVRHVTYQHGRDLCNKTLALMDEGYNHYLQHVSTLPWKGRLKQLNKRVLTAYNVYFNNVQRAMGAEAFDAAMGMMDDMQENLAHDLFIHRQSLLRILGKHYDGETRDTLADMVYCDHVAYMGDAHGEIILKCKRDPDIQNLGKALKTIGAELMGANQFEVNALQSEELNLSVRILATKVCDFNNP